MPSRRKPVVVEFTDQFGNPRKIHRANGSRLQLARERVTPILALTAAVGKLAGQRVKAARQARGMTLQELAERSGLAPATKHRMYEIENAMSGGMRLGTLYAIATALAVPISSLLPTETEVLAEAGVELRSEIRLGLAAHGQG
jgi:DNA-binding XRE family transcriptional regulator